MPLRRSATRTLWDASYTFAKTERPSLVSPIRAPRVVGLMAAWAAADSRVVSVAHPEVLRVLAAGRSTLPTFVPHISLLMDTGYLANKMNSCLTTLAGKT
jgi:hypothetical protein